MGRQRKNKANSAQKDNTPTNLPNSRETGHFSEPENKRPSMTTSPTTPVLTAGVAALTSGEVVSVLTGATAQGPPDSLNNTPPFVMAGNQDAFQMSGCTHLSAVDLQVGGGGPIRGRLTRCRTTPHPQRPLQRFDGSYNSSARQATRRLRRAE